MGASTFICTAQGATPAKAFMAAVETAAHRYGNDGYTGTIAEKDSFLIIPLPPGKDPHDYAEELIEERSPLIDDKWGPAGCIDLGHEQFLFFGWASS
jgi:hypothetical protein